MWEGIRAIGHPITIGVSIWIAVVTDTIAIAIEPFGLKHWEDIQIVCHTITIDIVCVEVRRQLIEVGSTETAVELKLPIKIRGKAALDGFEYIQPSIRHFHQIPGTTLGVVTLQTLWIDCVQTNLAHQLIIGLRPCNWVALNIAARDDTGIGIDN